MLYDLYSVAIRYNNKKLTDVNYIVSEFIRSELLDLEIFGIITQLTQSGYQNIVIETDMLGQHKITYDNKPVRFIMASVSKRYQMITFYIVTQFK